MKEKNSASYDCGSFDARQSSVEIAYFLKGRKAYTSYYLAFKNTGPKMITEAGYRCPREPITEPPGRRPASEELK